MDANPCMRFPVPGPQARSSVLGIRMPEWEPGTQADARLILRKTHTWGMQDTGGLVFIRRCAWLRLRHRADWIFLL
jgi:hypothetical protein